MTQDKDRQQAADLLRDAAIRADMAYDDVFSAVLSVLDADMPRALARIKRLQARMEAVIREIETEARIMEGQRAPENVSGYAVGLTREGARE